jgi:hypothetical protein
MIAKEKCHSTYTTRMEKRYDKPLKKIGKSRAGTWINWFIITNLIDQRDWQFIKNASNSARRE